MAVNKDLDLMIEIMNAKLSGRYELNYDGICLNLKKKYKEYCIYVSSDVHDVFERLLAIDSFITGLHYLNRKDNEL
mgnify:CR=1 FL=1|jgi:hypothetical protein